MVLFRTGQFWSSIIVCIVIEIPSKRQNRTLERRIKCKKCKESDFFFGRESRNENRIVVPGENR